MSHRAVLLLLLAVGLTGGSCGGGGGVGGSDPIPPPDAGVFDVAAYAAAGQLSLPSGAVRAAVTAIGGVGVDVPVGADGRFTGLAVGRAGPFWLLFLLDVNGNAVVPAFVTGALTSLDVGIDEVVVGIGTLTEFGFAAAGLGYDVLAARLRTHPSFAYLVARASELCVEGPTLLGHPSYPALHAAIVRAVSESFDALTAEALAPAGPLALRTSAGSRGASASICDPLPEDVGHYPAVASGDGAGDAPCGLYGMNPTSAFYELEVTRVLPGGNEPLARTALLQPTGGVVNTSLLNLISNDFLHRTAPASTLLHPRLGVTLNEGRYRGSAYLTLDLRDLSRIHGSKALVANMMYLVFGVMDLLISAKPDPTAATTAASFVAGILADPGFVDAVVESVLGDAELHATLDALWAVLAVGAVEHVISTVVEKAWDLVPKALDRLVKASSRGVLHQFGVDKAARRVQQLVANLPGLDQLTLALDLVNKYVPFWFDLLTKPRQVDFCFDVDVGGVATRVETDPGCPHQTPGPMFTLRPRVPEPFEHVVFDARGSTGAAAGTVEYQWDFDGRNGPDTAWIEQAVTDGAWWYSEPGAYEAILSIREKADPSSVATCRRTVHVAPVTVDLAAVVESATGRAPLSLAVRDLDGDGDLDAVVSMAGETSLAILRGRGRGVFEEDRRISLGSLTASDVCIADVNGDGRDDLVVLHPATNLVRVLLALPGPQGTRTLDFDETAPPISFGPGVTLSSLRVEAVDEDTLPDLVATDTAANLVHVWKGSGDPSFAATPTAPHRTFAVDLNPIAVAVARLDGDAVRDLVVANFTGDTLSVLRGLAGCDFEVVQRRLPAGQTTYGGPQYLAVGDLLPGGADEVVVTNARGASVACFRQRSGAPTLELEPAGADWVLGDSPRPVAIEELGSGTGAVLSLIWDATSEVRCYAPMTAWPPATGGHAHGVRVGAGARALRIQREGGRTILVTANEHVDSISAARFADGDGFEQRRDFATTESTGPEEPYDAVVADLVAGGGLDVAVLCRSSNSIVLFSNVDGKGGLQRVARLETGSEPLSICAADLTGDGVPELSVACNGDGTVRVYGRGSDGAYALRATTYAGNEPLRIVAPKPDGTWRGLLVVAHYNPSQVTVLRYADETTVPPVTDPTPQPPPAAPELTVLGTYGSGAVALVHSMGSGDLDGDAWPDFVFTNYFAGSVSWLHGTSTGALTSFDEALPGGTNPVLATIADVNGDKLGDIVLTGSAGGMTYLRTAAPGWAAPVPFDTGHYWENDFTDLVAEDVTEDGIPDLVVQDSSHYGSATRPGRSTVTVLSGDRSGAFPRRVSYLVGPGPVCLATGDLNGDRKPDVVTANHQAATISVLMHR